MESTQQVGLEITDGDMHPGEPFVYLFRRSLSGYWLINILSIMSNIGAKLRKLSLVPFVQIQVHIFPFSSLLTDFFAGLIRATASMILSL